jgi:hypothetical protein
MVAALKMMAFTQKAERMIERMVPSFPSEPREPGQFSQGVANAST